MEPFLRCIALVLALLAAGGPARATDAAETAAILKAQGDSLFEAKRYADALEVYEKAYEVKPDTVLLYNEGRALQFLGRYPEAVERLRRFREEASPELRAKLAKLDLLIDELDGRVATLVVDGSPPGARVLLGERVVGAFPLSGPLRVNAGAYRLEVDAEGYYPYKATLQLRGKQRTTVQATLASKATTGLLVVRSNVASSRVALDGKSLGLAPAEDTLVAGPHRVLVEAEGYDPAATTVAIAAGSRRELELDPRARPSILGRWWFWTAAALLVAVGVTTYVVLSTERPAEKGSFVPGNVSAGLRF